MLDAFGVERGLVSKRGSFTDEDNRWRLSNRELKAAKGTKKQRAADVSSTVGGQVAAAAGGLGMAAGGVKAAEGVSDFRRGLRWKKSQGSMRDAHRMLGHYEGTEAARAALRGEAGHKGNMARAYIKGGASSMKRGGAIAGAGALAAGTGMGLAIGASNRQHKRINAERAKAGLKPRSYWTGKPKD